MKAAFPTFLFISVLAASLGLIHTKNAWAANFLITSLPPLYIGLEADSNATLLRLLESRVQETDEEENANRSIKKNIIPTRSVFVGAHAQAGEWTLARLNRFHEASQRSRRRIDLFSPAREFIILLSDEERYGAEWSVTLRLLSRGRYPWSALAEISQETNNTHRALAGRLGYAAEPEREAEP
jgi:hypothetical protein